MSSGEERAWEIIRQSDPAELLKNAPALFDERSGVYVLRSFGMDITIDPAKESLETDSALGELLLGRLGYFSRLALLWYITGAKEIPLSGRLVKPVNLKGGQIFFRGTHTLPLDKLAARYAADKASFLAKGETLGGRPAPYGDEAVELFPFPRIPVVIILWEEDEEFPSRADLLFDSTCEFHLALDLLWSTAMESILIMM